MKQINGWYLMKMESDMLYFIQEWLMLSLQLEERALGSRTGFEYKSYWCFKFKSWIVDTVAF